MAREGKAGCKTGGRRKAGSTYRASDESDEDYAVDEDEVFDESEDGYESEESLGDLEDEEVEELKTKKMKKVLRSRAPRRNKNGSVKPRKRKRVSYREEDDDEDDEGDDDDVEFRPDCLDEEDEDFPVMKETKNSSKPQLRKGTVRDDDDDEEDGDDEELNPDGLDEEEEFPLAKGMKNSSRPRWFKGTAEDSDADDDEEDVDDEEFNPDGLDEEEDFPIMKEMKNSSKRGLRKGTSKNDDEDDGDDEEFTPDGLDEEEEFPTTKEMKNSSKRGLREGTSRNDDDEEFTPDAKDDDEEDGDDEEFTPDDLDEEEDLPIVKEIKNSSKRRLRKGTGKNDDEEDEDEDDEEFTPDDLDEDEEFPVIKEVKYSSKPRFRNGSSKQQKRSRNFKDLKNTRRKLPKRRRLKRKARSENDEEFIDVDPIVGEKNKNNAGQRRKGKRLRVHSDSDFVVSSGSSDREFTISEEEREQIREASKFCRGLVTAWKGSASLKNSSREEEDPRLQRKHPGRKAKEKVEEMKSETGKQICGICLSEEGKRIVRGTLNCCSHYFCFACIMEWSKVESRCPLCKQRFATISKPARSDSGFDLRTVAIQVPERDQVYQPSEEELRGYLDPYENVLCTECQQGGDDALMLLCDLCDSPAHTYCVGLGHEVPDGNWYCESCRPSALASSNPRNLNPMPDNRTSGNFSVGSPPVDNVRESFDLNEMYVPDTPLIEESGDFQSPRDGQGASLFAGVGASTVSDRRRIQWQIHQLLQNRRQFGNISGTMSAVSGNSLFGSQIARNRELTTQPAVVQRAAPYSTFFQGRQPESNARLSHNWNNLAPERSSNLSGQPNLNGASIRAAPNSTFLQGRQPESNAWLSHNWNNLVPERSSNLSGQPNLNGASTSSHSFLGDFLGSDLQGTGASINLGLVHQQLHPFGSRSNVVPDTSTSPCQFREPTVPTRTLPSTLRRPF